MHAALCEENIDHLQIKAANNKQRKGMKKQSLRFGCWQTVQE